MRAARTDGRTDGSVPEACLNRSQTTRTPKPDSSSIAPHAPGLLRCLEALLDCSHRSGSLPSGGRSLFWRCADTPGGSSLNWSFTLTRLSPRRSVQARQMGLRCEANVRATQLRAYDDRA